MGVSRAIVASHAPSLASVAHLEEVAGKPFTKNVEFAAAIDACVTSTPAAPADAGASIGRAGYTLLARLLEVYAGAAPRSADEATTSSADEATEPPTRVHEAAYRFCSHVIADGSSLTGKNIPQLVNGLLSVEAIQKEFDRRYDLPDKIELADAELHRTGTTSAIFRCGWDGNIDVALKVTLPRYFGVDTLADVSAAYSSEFRAPPQISPHVYRSGRRYIVMGFVAGQTLEERFAELTADGQDPRPIRARVSEAFAVMLALMRALDRLFAAGENVASRHHLDLTPNNVIVPAFESIADLKLIDFGRNQLLIEPIAASSSAIAKAAHYVAPEISNATIDDRSDLAASAADAYSAGLLALEAFSPGDEQSLDSKLDKLWEQSPGLAMILEDVLVSKAPMRLQLVPAAERSAPFAYLIKRLEREIEVQQEFATELVPAGVVGNALRLIGRPQQIGRMYKVSQKFAGEDSDYRRYRGLALWNALAMLAWLSIWVTVLGLAMYHVGKALHLEWIDHRGVQLGELTLQSFRSEQFPRDLWGRVVAFSFGLMAFTYYTNIYATVWFPTTAEPWLRRRARLANAMARSLAFVTPAPCIVGALVEPRIWPWATIFGVCWAAGSNWAMAWLYRGVRTATKNADGRDVDPTESTWKIFREWAFQMTVYAVGVAILALALHFLTHSRVYPVNNVGAYVTVLTFLNLFFIVRLNCIQQAPEMRGYLQRTAFHLRRLAATG